MCGASSDHVWVEAATSVRGPGGEAAHPRDQHVRRVLGRGLERQPVVDVLGDRPHLLASLDRVLAPVGQIDEVVPSACRTHPAYRQKQTVEILGLDQLLQILRHGGTMLP